MARTLEPAFDTPVNREAFADRPQRTLTPAVAATPAEEAALKALKQNIADLENMIEERDAAMQAALAPAPAPKIGDGKTVLISGTTSGIGRATARRLAQDGYRLILLGRREERLEALREELFTEYATDTHLLIVDIRERDRVVEAIASLPEGWQTIDILLNNAGKAKGFDPIQEGKYEHWEEMIDVNLKGLLSLTREISPLMVARGEGTIINVASTAGKEVYPNGNVYCATKHAVDALTYAMRLDLVK
ncbi:MAG: SDR family NAD(P)-dependent oxidoreductase, partial [Bacteroidota bacterium]